MKVSVLIRNVIIVHMMTLSALVYAKDNKMVIRDCYMDQILDTPITFFIAKSVKERYAPFVVEGHITSWIKFSNQALTNSCIPMKRTLAEIVYLDEIVNSEFQSIDLVHNLLEYFQPEKINALSQNTHHYYGVVFDIENVNFHPEKCGETDVSLYPQFFILDIGCKSTVLEHELGHLAWANHDMDTLSVQSEGSAFDYDNFLALDQQHNIKPYSYGYLCGGKGTVMSYAEELHPFYSTPDITYGGITCGNKHYANNAEVLRAYALEHLAKK